MSVNPYIAEGVTNGGNAFLGAQKRVQQESAAKSQLALENKMAQDKFEWDKGQPERDTTRNMLDYHQQIVTTAMQKLMNKEVHPENYPTFASMVNPSIDYMNAHGGSYQRLDPSKPPEQTASEFGQALNVEQKANLGVVLPPEGQDANLAAFIAANPYASKALPDKVVPGVGAIGPMGIPLSPTPLMPPTVQTTAEQLKPALFGAKMSDQIAADRVAAMNETGRLKREADAAKSSGKLSDIQKSEIAYMKHLEAFMPTMSEDAQRLLWPDYMALKAKYPQGAPVEAPGVPAPAIANYPRKFNENGVIVPAGGIAPVVPHITEVNPDGSPKLSGLPILPGLPGHRGAPSGPVPFQRRLTPSEARIPAEEARAKAASSRAEATRQQSVYQSAVADIHNGVSRADVISGARAQGLPQDMIGKLQSVPVIPPKATGINADKYGRSPAAVYWELSKPQSAAVASLGFRTPAIIHAPKAIRDFVSDQNSAVEVQTKTGMFSSKSVWKSKYFQTDQDPNAVDDKGKPIPAKWTLTSAGRARVQQLNQAEEKRTPSTAPRQSSNSSRVSLFSPKAEAGLMSDAALAVKNKYSFTDFTNVVKAKHPSYSAVELHKIWKASGGR